MCLEKLAPTEQFPTGVSTGYKVMYEEDGIPYSGYIAREGNSGIDIKDRACPIGKWSYDFHKHTIEDVVSYPSGFHISQTLENCKSFRRDRGWYKLSIFEVQFRNVVAIGYQDNSIVYIAKSIKVIKKVVEGE